MRVKKEREQQTVLLRLQKSGGVSNPTAGSRLSPGSCIFWHICRSPSRPGWCWIRFYTSAEWETAFIRPPPSCYRVYIHTCSAHYTHTKSCVPRGAVAVKTLESSTHPRLLGQVSVHLLLAEWSHFLYLLVVQLHPLLILGDLLSIKQLVCRGVLEHTFKNSPQKSWRWSPPTSHRPSVLTLNGNLLSDCNPLAYFLLSLGPLFSCFFGMPLHVVYFSLCAGTHS